MIRSDYRRAEEQKSRRARQERGTVLMQIDNYKMNWVYRHNSEAKGTPIKKDKAEESKDSKTAKKHRKKIAGKTLSQFDNEFWEYILFLINNANQYTPLERNEIVEEMAEYYTLKTDYQLPNNMCSALADFILDDTLSDPSCHKVQRDDYPVMSWRQLVNRHRREMGVESDTLEYLGNRRRYPKNKRQTSERSENK